MFIQFQFQSYLHFIYSHDMQHMNAQQKLKANPSDRVQGERNHDLIRSLFSVKSQFGLSLGPDWTVIAHTLYSITQICLQLLFRGLYYHLPFYYCFLLHTDHKVNTSPNIKFNSVWRDDLEQRLDVLAGAKIRTRWPSDGDGFRLINIMSSGMAWFHQIVSSFSWK